MRTICVYPYRSRCGWFVDFVYLVTHRETGRVNHLGKVCCVREPFVNPTPEVRTSLVQATMSSGVSFAGSNAAAELYAGHGSEGRDG